jgi:hypothetical protein
VEVREGKGWRLVFDPARHPFVLLIGGGPEDAGAWAAELSGAEAQALQAGIGRLAEQHRALVPSLMAEEAIDLELEVACAGGGLWLALAGDRSGWSLRFVLTPAAGSRGLEGSWERSASGPLAAALAALPLGALPLGALPLGALPLEVLDAHQPPAGERR